MAQMSNRGAQLFCSLFIVIGLIAVGIGIWTLTKSILSEHWPVTDGIVQSAEMKSHSGGRGGTTYSAEVAYGYLVAGTSYTGNKVSIGQMSSSSEYAQGILNRYPVGKKVSVHYSPGDPSDAVLETGIHGGTWICLGVGTAFTLFGIMFLQISRAAAKAQLPDASQSPTSSVTVQPGGRVTMDQPPVLMGVIFLLVGIGICFLPPAYGICGISHPRDLINWIVNGLFGTSFSLSQYALVIPVLTYVGVVIGSALSALGSGELHLRSTGRRFSPVVFGFGVANFGMLMGYCSVRAIMLLAYGNVLALPGLAGIVVGVVLACRFVKWRVKARE